MTKVFEHLRSGKAVNAYMHRIHASLAEAPKETLSCIAGKSSKGGSSVTTASAEDRKSGNCCFSTIPRAFMHNNNASKFLDSI
eukprot:scaffold435_cov107-Cylindrotheca_fusiformis.AAC.2